MKILDLSRCESMESLSPDSLVREVLLLGGKACITNSFQVEDMVVLHLLRQIEPQVPVLFLDTGYHFAETYAYRDRMAQEWKLNLISLHAQQSVAEQESAFGILNRTDPTRCCGLRKVDPLMRGLASYDIWFTGLRRDQSPTRKNLRKVEHHALPAGKKLLKVSPLADWDSKAGVELCRTEPHRISAALRQGLHQHRMRALHIHTGRSGKSALRPLVWPEARVRYSHIHRQKFTPGNPMTELTIDPPKTLARKETKAQKTGAP